MDVNSYTLQLGDRAEDAIARLFKLGKQARVIPVKVVREFIE